MEDIGYLRHTGKVPTQGWGAGMLRAATVKEWSDEDQRVFDAIVPEDHRLRKIAAAIDFEAFHGALAGYYHPSMGRPADAVLSVKVIFLQYFDRLSDRQMIERSRTDMAVRWFLGLALDDGPPDASSLSRFRSRLGAEGTQQVLGELIRQAREHQLLKCRLRLKDATHVVADVALPAALTLVAQAREKLLAAAAPFAAEQVAAAEARRTEIRLATEGSDDEARLEPRVEQLRALVALADGLPRPADADESAWTKLEQARQLAHAILHDQDHPDAGDRTRSVVDPDARRGKHGEYFDGYLVDVMMDADSELITALNVLPANGNEGADAVTLVHQEEAVTGEDIQALSIDGAGHAGAVLRELQAADGLNVEVFVPPKESPATDKFTPDDFSEDADHRVVTCPAGQTSHYRQRDEAHHSTIYRFPQATCANCPLRDRCLSRSETKASPFGRTVRKSDFEVEYRMVREKATTAAYAAVRKEHPKIERKLSEMVRRHNARRARYRGLLKVLAQMIWIAVAVNIKRLTKLLGVAQETPRLAVA
jgi:transposase